MGTLIRWLIIIGVGVLLYGMYEQRTNPTPAGERGRLWQLRQLGRKARLVALIYVVVILVSGFLRLAGIIE